MRREVEQVDGGASQPHRELPLGVSRRNFLLGGGLLATTGGAMFRILSGSAVEAQTTTPPPAVPAGGIVHMIATDGWASMPAGSPAVTGYWPDPLAPANTNVYTFGFRNVTDFVFANGVAPSTQGGAWTPGVPSLSNPNQQVGILTGAFKGTAQISAPTLVFRQNQETRIRLSNLGLVQRPDLTDGHTLHWHGFRNAIPLFDGVPELSISAAIGATLEYDYIPHEAGTYMYHCHFEDVEHVQMGMVGLLYVRPADFNALSPTLRKAYAEPETAYDREYPFMLNELWAEGHWRDAHIQTTDWTNYDPSFFLMNGRAYPDTIAPGGWDPSDATVGVDALRSQPISSRISCNPGEKVLLRFANLGFQNHAMTVEGLQFRVIAKDASSLYKAGVDLSYETNVVDLAPGESCDVIFVAPASGTYRLYDRNFTHSANNGSGDGGMQTDIVVESTPAPTFTFSGRTA